MSSKNQDKAKPGTAEPAGVALGETNLEHKKLPKSSMETSSPSMLQAKKKLRAFSIQKKATITPVTVSKPVGTGSSTVLIGKLSGVKTTPKPEPVDDVKKPPKPPRPGAQETYIELQKKNMAEIEDMKRKMELVDLGIPLGLICPTATSEKGMPTKAMPPIKSYLERKFRVCAVPKKRDSGRGFYKKRYVSTTNPAQVDELICVAKKARAEGREFKFELQKFLPDYDNPFQRKKDYPMDIDKKSFEHETPTKSKEDKRSSSRFERRYSEYRKDDRTKDDREKYTSKNKEKEKKERERRKEEKREHKKEDVKKDRRINKPEKDIKETNVHLNDYLVCDSWSLDTDKTNSSSPKHIDKSAGNVVAPKVKSKDPSEKAKESQKTIEITTPKDFIPTKPIKVEKLQPVVDSFKYELDANEDEILDIFEEDTNLEKYAKPMKKDQSYDSPMKFDYNQEPSTADDDNFLESIINEIKQEDLSDISQDKGLVEYDLSPKDDQVIIARESVTPELDDRMRSQQSHYSDGYRSSESGYKSRESGYRSDRSDSYRMGAETQLDEPSDSKISKKTIKSYRSSESGYRTARLDSYMLSVDKEFHEALESKMSKSTMESLETWSFVLKICQPLLFRHDRKKCYKETHTTPKLWYTENPRGCNCVKDRAIVYGELETCKMSLVDRVYGCDQIPDTVCPKVQNWYPRVVACLSETSSVQLSTDWETEECQPEPPPMKQKTKEKRKSTTPQESKEISLDREYKKFMEAVWPEVNEAIQDTPRSTTPVRQEIKRKKKEEDKEAEEKKKVKKIKLSSEGWSQESEVEEETPKNKKLKVDKEKRKRKLSTSTLSSSSSDSDDHDAATKKKKMSTKKKISKKLKSKSAKRRRLSKKYIMKKLKEKQRKKRKFKIEKKSEDSDGGVMERESNKEKKARKKRDLKLKKVQKKKKAKAKSSSSSSSSDSSSETDSDERRRRKRKQIERKKRKDKKKRKKSTSSSTQSDDLFDVNILKNIKTERLSDEEKNLTDFSPRRQKPREIINVKELQNDFVGNNIHIKQEKEDETVERKEEKSESEVKDVQVEAQADSNSRIDAQTEESVDSSKKAEVKEPQEPSQLVTKPLPVPEPQKQHVQLIPEPTPHIPESVPDITEPTAQITIPVAQIPVPPPQIPVPPPQKPVGSPQMTVPPQVPVPPQKPLPPPQKSAPPSQKSVSPPQNPIPAPQNPTPPIHIPVPPSHKPVPLPQIPIPYTPDQIQDATAPIPDESNNSQCSSQESVCSIKDAYEKDDSHLRPSSQNSNYSFNDVISASQGMFQKVDDMEDKFEGYEQGNYEMYEHLAMAYQSNVANQISLPSSTIPVVGGSDAGPISRIETVVGARRGEIKCDWRAGDRPAAHQHQRPSRWGLKPGEVNIVLTDGGGDRYSSLPVCAVEPVYQIESIANRTTDNTSMSYDEAYMDMYGASDKLQYGDCFAVPVVTEMPAPSAERAGPAPQSEPEPTPARRTSSLDARIDQVLRDTPLSEVAKTGEQDDKDTREKGILMSKSLSTNVSGRCAKRVSFADGYKPGQDSDVEEPPVKKKKKVRRRGCAWPCPATHPDHVPLWDALPPPPPPPGSPPPPPSLGPPAALLAALRRPSAPTLMPDLRSLGHHHQKFDPTSPMPPFLPPEPPPGMINFH